MREEWLFPGAVVPVDVETTAALLAEIKRLIDVVGGMALAQPKQKPMHPELRKMLEDYFDKCFAESAPQRPWVGLTDDEQQQAYEQWQNEGWDIFYRAIEAKLKEKNT
jgi:hypothetical protein